MQRFIIGGIMGQLELDTGMLVAEQQTFGSALNTLIANPDRICFMRLPYWKNDVRISIANEGTSHPYLMVTSRFGTVPWNPTQVELLSHEWTTVVQ